MEASAEEAQEVMVQETTLSGEAQDHALREAMEIVGSSSPLSDMYREDPIYMLANIARQNPGVSLAVRVWEWESDRVREGESECT